ncbi:MAG: hypothetical protein ACRD96_13875, partial [Bryobacteraceae bacterium]
AFRLPATTDGTGFFGAVDLAPDRYRVRIERGGRELFRTTPREVRAGGATAFEIFLKAADFAGVLPRVTGVERKSAAAPGDIVTLNGSALAAEESWATAVPLPFELGRTQVVVNGAAAPLIAALPDRIEVQLPYGSAAAWNIVVKHAGLESAAFTLPAVAASPEIVGVAHLAAGYVEIYATGLGAIDPPQAAGLGGNPAEPYHRARETVRVRIGDAAVEPLYAGLAPYQPGRYQVNIRLPDGVTRGELRLDVAGALSSAFAFTRP